MKLYYTIEVRQPNGKFYFDSAGKKVINRFSFEDAETNESLIKLICSDQYRSYKAITNSSNITITVSTKNSIAGTYMALYEYNKEGFKKLT